MYPVSDAFLRAVRSNTRKYFWTGTIVTKGGMTYAGAFFVGKWRWRDVSCVGCFSEGSQE